MPKRAIIVGCGPDAKQDYITARSLIPPEFGYAPVDIIMAINHVGIELMAATHWASLHAHEMRGWAGLRDEAGLPEAVMFGAEIHRRNDPSCNYPWMKWVEYPWDGTSSALGMFACKSLGVTKMLLCGVPLVDGPHYYQGPEFKIADYTRRQWLAHMDELTEVRSMSGWTREKLGGLTADWWNGE